MLSNRNSSSAKVTNSKTSSPTSNLSIFSTITNTLPSLFSLAFLLPLFSLLILFSFSSASLAITLGDILKNKSPQSAAGTDATAPSGNEPEVVENVVDKLSGLKFTDTNNDYLTYDGKDIVGSDYTIIITEKRGSDKANNCLMGTTNTSPSANEGFSLCYASDEVVTIGQGSNKISVAIAPFTNVNDQEVIQHIITHSNSDGKKYYRNGALVHADPTNTTPLESNDNTTIGRDGNNYYNGNILELAIVKRVLPSHEIKPISDYLISKWDINEVAGGTGCTPASPGYQDITDGQWTGNGTISDGAVALITCINGTSEIGTISPLSCSNGVYSGGTGGSCGVVGCPSPSVEMAGYCWVIAQVYNQSHSDACDSVGKTATATRVDLTWDETLLGNLSTSFGFTSIGDFANSAYSMWCNYTTNQCGTHNFYNQYWNYGNYYDINWIPVYTCNI
jgi:hypothetical protein